MASLDIKELIHKHFQPIFFSYDKDASSSLEKEELRALLADNLGVDKESITQDQLDWHFSRIDENGDGKITFEEYVSPLLPSSATSSALGRSTPRPTRTS